MAKIKYTIKTRAPTNQDERPAFVTMDAVMVAMKIMITAPGQNGRLIGAGPMT